MAVVNHLVEAGYVRASNELRVAGVNFVFDAVLTTPRSRLNFVLVVADAGAESRLNQRMQALSRGLDFVGSRGTLTLIVVGPEPSLKVRAEISRFARVLHVENSERVSSALNVLMPLASPAASPNPVDVTKELRESVSGANVPDIFMTQFDSPETVREILRSYLIEGLEAKGR